MKRLELLIHISGISGVKDMLGRDPARSEYMLGFVPELSSPVLFDALEKNAKDLKGKKEKYGLSDFTIPKPEKEALYDLQKGGDKIAYGRILKARYTSQTLFS